MDIRRGTIRAFDSATYLADVQIVGSMATMLSAVPVAKQIGAELLTSGTKCGVLFFDETNPSDACVAFVYDGVPSHPSARVYHDADQTIPNAIDTVLAFNSERFDTDDIHDTVTNNSRLTCKTAGKYQISATVRFASNNVGARGLWIRLNGSTRLAMDYRANALVGADFLTITTLYELAVNDYVELMAYQASGGNLAVQSAANYGPEFMMVKVA